MSFGYTTARFAIRFNKTKVYLSIFLTLISVLALTIYAYKTKQDFTLLGGLLCVLLVLLIVGIFLNIFLRIKILDLLFNILGIILFSFYIIYDTQLIIGKYSLKLSEDDYALGVINLYLDIINLFVLILNLMGRNN